MTATGRRPLTRHVSPATTVYSSIFSPPTVRSFPIVVCTPLFYSSDFFARLPFRRLFRISSLPLFRSSNVSVCLLRFPFILYRFSDFSFLCRSLFRSFFRSSLLDGVIFRSNGYFFAVFIFSFPYTYSHQKSTCRRPDRRLHGPPFLILVQRFSIKVFR